MHILDGLKINRILRAKALENLRNGPAEIRTGRRGREGEPVSHNPLPFYTRNWEEVNKSLFKALKLERFALSIILGLIILVAALNIISTLTMLVMEKNKDISILRAMGTKRSSIRRIFIIDGMIIGVIGTFLGTLFGYLFCYFLKTNETLRSFIPFDNKVYPISEFPVKIEPLYFVIVAICSLLICFIATMYPSYQASKKDPVEALRYE